MTEQNTEINELRKKVEDLKLENKQLRTSVSDSEELVSSYRKVIDDRKGTTVYPPGSKVAIGPNHLEATVLSVTMFEKGLVVYKVGLWIDNCYRVIDLPDYEVLDESTLPPVGM